MGEKQGGGTTRGEGKEEKKNNGKNKGENITVKK